LIALADSVPPAYLAWIPLGDWNRLAEGTMLQAILSGRGIQTGDLGMLVFVTLPGVLFWMAYYRSSFWFAVPALTLDLVWLVMQIQSWWFPYIFGTDRSWQLAHAMAATTKVLPSFDHRTFAQESHLLVNSPLCPTLFFIDFPRLSTYDSR
jgi:hypothetical protein